MGPCEGLHGRILQAHEGQLELIGTKLPIHTMDPCEYPSGRFHWQLLTHPTVSAAMVCTPNGPIPNILSNFKARKKGPCKKCTRDRTD